MDSHLIFAKASLKPWSSLSVPPKLLGLQEWTTTLGPVTHFAIFERYSLQTAYCSGLFSICPQGKWFRKVCMHCWDSLHQGIIKVWVDWPDTFVPAQNSKGWYQLQSRVLWAEVFLASMLLSCFSKSGVLTQGLMLRQALLMLELLCQPFSCDFFLFETRSHCTICPVLGLTSNIWSSCCLHRE
jgi:hypothetical protein